MIYTENEKALIYLSKFDFMSSQKFEQVLSYFDNPSEIFTSKTPKLFALKDVLGDKYDEFIAGISNYSENYFETLNRKKISCLTIISENYPQKLLNLKNPPYVLYYYGDISLLNTRCVAMVGTRSPSAYGRIVTEKYASELAGAGLTIVSGLASGVDKISHEGALAVGGKTIAVLGGGFDHIYPAMNVNLARQIASSGLVITEYHMAMKPTKFTFPTRNRIIAALSQCVIITEAGEKSGSLYTKEHADSLGIDTYCVPGNITSEKSKSTNRMIKSGVAGCTTSPEDILSALGIKPIIQEKKTGTKSCGVQLTIEQESIVALLKDSDMDFEELSIKTGFTSQNLNYNLTTLEIRGIIKKLVGNSYTLV